MRKLTVFLFATVVLCMWALPAFSQDSDDSALVRGGKGACKADMEKLCKGIKPGEGRLAACMKSNGDRLSQACKDHMAMMREKGKEFRQACKDDVKKLCKDAPRGKGGMMACLKEHQADLSDACKALFTK